MRTAVIRFFRSVAGKVFCVLTVCILALLLFNWLLNTFAFAKMSERETEAVLTQAYTDAADAITRRVNPEQVLLPYHTDYDMSILIRTDHQVIYANPLPDKPAFLTPAYSPANGSYVIVDRDDGLALYGKTVEGIHIILHLPNSRKTVNASSRFLWWATLATLAVSCVITFVLARVFTRPVRRLSDMAGRMASMDFSDRYVGTGQDELAELGHSLNTVSETMEHSLSELKPPTRACRAMWNSPRVRTRRAVALFATCRTN